MTSFCARIVKTAIRLYTFRYRRRQMSLSQNVALKPRPYKCPEGFTHCAQTFNGVKVEIIAPCGYCKDKIILHFHGGGARMDMESLFYRKVAQSYAVATGMPVYTVDYVADVNKTHPSLLNECYSAYKGLSERFGPENIVAVGDSMGANLMLATCLKARDEELSLPVGLVSVCGFLDHSASGESYRRNSHRDPMYALPFYMNKDKHADKLRRVPPYAAGCDLKDPFLSPAFGRYDGFPPMLIVCGADEVDESDSAMLYEAAERCGVTVEYKKYAGMFHDFLYIAPFMPESRNALKDICRFITSF